MTARDHAREVVAQALFVRGSAWFGDQADAALDAVLGLLPEPYQCRTDGVGVGSQPDRLIPRRNEPRRLRC